MDPENEKIQLDDITFDDVIGGDGVETVAIDEEIPTTEEPKNVEQEEEVQQEEVVNEVENQEPQPVKEEVKEEIEKDEETEVSEDSTVVSEILNAFGYETDNEYEDTSEGLINMTKDIAQTLADERIDEVMNKFPLVRQHLEYVLNGGESQNFMQAYDPNLDYNKIKIESDDVRSQKAVLAEYFSLKGHDRDFTKEMISDYSDSGKLHDKAEAARVALGKVQQQRQMQMVEQQKQMRAQQYQQQEEFWKGVADTLENGKEFSGLTVPEREKSKFFNYLSKPINQEGYTQRDLDHSEAALETRLAIDYLMFKGFNLDQIINTKAKTRNSKSLRDKISRNEESVKSARKSSRRAKNFDIDELDLSI
tara:strand:- start:578 stop:1669 length:1092 start_codon:yes stop_codon:yes gene_type:complete